MSVVIKQKNPGWLEKLLRAYSSEAVLAVGFPRGTNSVGIRYPDGTSLLMVAAVNNFGSASRGIPARPFMFEGGPAAIKATAPVAAVMIPFVNRGKATIEQALAEMGPYAQGAFQETITDHAWTPNTEATIKAKGSAQPLIHTGLLRGSMTWIVRKAE